MSLGYVTKQQLHSVLCPLLLLEQVHRLNPAEAEHSPALSSVSPSAVGAGSQAESCCSKGLVMAAAS